MTRTRARRLTAVAALSVLALLPAAVASAATVSGGCTGSATTYSQDGDVVGHAKAPGAGGTQDDPLVVDPQGSIAWEGSTPAAITTGTYAVSIGGATVKSGDIDNPGKKTSASGVTTIDELAVPSAVKSMIKFVFLSDGKLKVGATVDGSGQSCTATVWITGIGGATGSPMFWTGAGALLIAFLLLWWLIAGTTAEPAAAGATSAAPVGETVSGAR